MSRGRLFVVGTGPGPAYLTPAAAAVVGRCEVFVGGDAALRVAPAWGERIKVSGSMDAVIAEIDRRLSTGRDVCVLTSGDPGYFSLLGALERALPGEAVVEPGIASVQLLAARVGIPWQEAAHYSVHGRELELVPDQARPFAVLCGGEHSPDVVARLLLDMGLAAHVAVGCRLGGPDEEILVGDLTWTAGRAFAQPAVMLVAPESWLCAGVRSMTPRMGFARSVSGPESGAPVAAPGIPDDAFERAEGVPLSRWEVRSVLAAVARPAARRVIWDIGAGSGGFAVEFALLSPLARVVAFERDPAGCAATRVNAGRFGARVEVVEGEVPSVLGDSAVSASGASSVSANDGSRPVRALAPGADDPDLVVVGGSGGRLEELLEVLADRVAPGGRVVVTSVTLETQGTASRHLRRPPWVGFDALQLSSSRLDRAGIMKGMNPVTLLWADKESGE